MEENLPSGVLQTVLAKTDARDCARAACVDRLWRHTTQDETLWRSYCLRDFAVSSLVDPSGQSCSSYKETYKVWQKSFSNCSMSLVARTKHCWDTLKEWLQENFIEILESLAPGASWEEIEDAEAQLGFRLPESVRLLYRFCNGQGLLADNDLFESSLDCNYLGLLGGYYFYQHFVNVYLLPLRQVVMVTTCFVPQLNLPAGMKRIAIGTSCNSKKIFFLDCDDGLVYVGTNNLQYDGEMMPCVPRLQKEGENELKDGMLRWLEHYGHCLKTDMYKVRVDDGTRSISLFPLKEPYCTTATTHGIQVRCSAVFVPEISKNEDGEEDSYLFSYSVCMRLLPANISTEQDRCSLESAQLSCRHWIIRANDAVVSEVRAEAVIGMYPLLEAGGEGFVYESCSALSSTSGSIEGGFSFVPGRLSRPEGAEFVARVASFPLQVPPFIY